MADFLVSELAVVLQDVVVCRAGGNGDFLCDGLCDQSVQCSHF